MDGNEQRSESERRRSAESALDAAIHGLASHRASTLGDLERALSLAPDLVVPHLMMGFAAKLLARRDREEQAGRDLAAARAALDERGGSRRERALLASLSSWCDGNPWRAADLLDESITRSPCDLLAIKLCHALRFMLGDLAGMRRTIEGALPSWDRALPERAWVEGCWAFTLEESGELERAERVGREALERNPIDPWGAHAVAHVWHTRGDARSGLAWLDRTEGCLAGANNFGAHVYWHRAVLLLSLGELDRALDLYDRRVVLPASIDYRDFVNATTLLYRLARRGGRLGNRWDHLAAIATSRLGDHTLAFADLHYVIALVGSQRLAEAASFVTGMRARTGGTTADPVLRDVGVPLAQAIVDAAHAPEAAHRTMLAVRSELPRLGGSHAQREIFTLVAHDTLARATPALVGAPKL